MKAKFIFLSAIIFSAGFSNAQIYSGKSYEVSFFSDGPVEDIAATSKSAQVILNSAKNEIAVKVTIKGFDFEKELMQEHFNEKYLESDKYPYATFTGKIKDTIDYKKDGIYKVAITGKLKMHDVEKERTIQGTLIVKGGEILIESKFVVALKDHKIEIPTLVAQNIAEIVEVTLKLGLTEFKLRNIKLGMNQQEVEKNMGKPKNINTTVLKGISSEQWVYDKVNIYFDHGKVSGWQESK